jgi:hypothetical protein
MSPAGLYLLALFVFAPVALAQTYQPTAELFAGFEVSDNYAGIYVGGSTALGKGLYWPGFRLWLGALGATT